MPKVNAACKLRSARRCRSHQTLKTHSCPRTRMPLRSRQLVCLSSRLRSGASVVIKGEVSGPESLYIDGRIEGAVNFAGHRVTIGGNGSAAANISAREVVIIARCRATSSVRTA